MVIFVSAIVREDRVKIQSALTRQLAEMSECSFPTLLRASNPLACQSKALTQNRVKAIETALAKWLALITGRV